jgi:hypothetical protein
MTSGVLESVWNLVSCKDRGFAKVLANSSLHAKLRDSMSVMTQQGSHVLVRRRVVLAVTRTQKMVL